MVERGNNGSTFVGNAGPGGIRNREIQDPATFPLTWPGDETIIVLEGEVRIELVDTGEVVELKEGDIASFPKGARSVWTVKSPFKEFFVLSG